ncbi:hypothetical protein DM794_06790 [Paenarthrobacter ureafaciens]|uniref:hypothetical protein n=1 Tax=Paenarthrobacter TaxID=1742992 RepID=UPI0015C05E8E|nr:MULTISPECIES: hypothetical protein [Paenarthrobacter]NWL10436.1 hypothetical protein [Paenarthrobacter nitroguajacolicus]NWL26770.1 hypothetical protein [Paenarthrobacter ureafaciens]NWL31960.1 hypothetical protein [Paenarthrobacter nitroguajacolicus]
MSKRNDDLAAVIAEHFDVTDLDACEDAELVESITSLTKKIHSAGLGPSSVKGLVNTEGVRQILGLASIESTRVTMSRDKAFPAAVVTEKLWKADEVRKYSLEREKTRLGAPGRPPISSRRHADEA